MKSFRDLRPWLVLVFLFIVAVVAAAWLGRGLFTRPGPMRQLVVAQINLEYDGAEPLAVIVESRIGEVSTPWAYAMLGSTGGMQQFPSPLPEGAQAVLRLALGADIMGGSGVRASGSLRGLTGALDTVDALSFRNSKDEAILALPPNGPPILVRVTTRDGKLIVGEYR